MGVTIYSASSSNSVIIPWIGPSPGKKRFASTLVQWGNWNHIVVTFNASCEPIACYINGALAEQSGTDYWSGANMGAAIGKRPNNSLPYLGYIGNLKIFKKEFTQDDIVALYNKEKTKFE
jgi:hypothetical protein